MWPILGKVYHKKYISKPFLIAIYYEHSTSMWVEEYFQKFVNETNDLILNGLTIQNTHYSFFKKAFSCDLPVRAYINKCKCHNSFFLVKDALWKEKLWKTLQNLNVKENKLES